MINALRLNEGFAPDLFIERTGINIADIQGQLKQAEAKKLITWDIKKITPTKLGRQFLDDLLLIFMKD
jgi:oxygen-independent coproporphyrinogen-3 oxidase